MVAVHLTVSQSSLFVLSCVYLCSLGWRRVCHHVHHFAFEAVGGRLLLMRCIAVKEQQAHAIAMTPCTGLLCCDVLTALTLGVPTPV